MSSKLTLSTLSSGRRGACVVVEVVEVVVVVLVVLVVVEVEVEVDNKEVFVNVEPTTRMGSSVWPFRLGQPKKSRTLWSYIEKKVVKGCVPRNGVSSLPNRFPKIASIIYGDVVAIYFAHSFLLATWRGVSRLADSVHNAVHFEHTRVHHRVVVCQYTRPPRRIPTTRVETVPREQGSEPMRV